MAWLESIAGSTYATAMMWTLGALLLLVVILLLIKVVRSLSFGTFVSGGRNRKNRLAVMDATAVDSHRRLVLVRRDDVEHLILIGGPTDVVVEQNIRLAPVLRRPAEEAPAPREVRLPPDAHAMTPAAPPAEVADTPARSAPAAAPADMQPPAPPRPQPAPVQAAPLPPRAPAANPGPAPQHPAAPAHHASAATLRPVAPGPQPASAAPRPAMAPTPLRPAPTSPPAQAAPPPRPAAPAAPAPQHRVANDQPPSLDDALLEELEVTLDRSAAEDAGAGQALPSSVEDEMAKLLGDLARPRR